MRRLILAILLCFFSVQAFSQSVEDARILERDESFVMNSKTDGSYKVHVRVRAPGPRERSQRRDQKQTSGFQSRAPP